MKYDENKNWVILFAPWGKHSSLYWHSCNRHFLLVYLVSTSMASSFPIPFQFSYSSVFFPVQLVIYLVVFRCSKFSFNISCQFHCHCRSDSFISVLIGDLGECHLILHKVCNNYYSSIQIILNHIQAFSRTLSNIGIFVTMRKFRSKCCFVIQAQLLLSNL